MIPPRDPLDYATARAPIYAARKQILAMMETRSTIRDSILVHPDIQDPHNPMQENEVARHKIFDFLGLLGGICEDRFLAANVSLIRASHRIQFEAIIKLLREVSFVPLEMEKIAVMA